MEEGQVIAKVDKRLPKDDNVPTLHEEEVGRD